MASTSPDAAAAELLGYCLRGERWPAALVDALRGDEALIRVVAEGLSDRFEPLLCDTYAELFAEAFQLGAGAVERYRRVRVPRRVAAEPRRVVVLSRVTLGADVAVAGVMLDAAMRAWPGAETLFAAPRKNWELFGGHPRIGHLPVAYRREQPLAHLGALRQAVSPSGTIVIDPDSRLTQLGLLEVCPEENCFFFESRGYGGEGRESLCTLAARWARETIGVEGAAFVAPAEKVPVDRRPVVAVSLGVGGNPAKRLPDPFEERLLALLADTGADVWIDRGAGGEEAERVGRAVRRFPRERLRVWEGSFAGFASVIAASDLYVGYDSAGQHVAAACGTPLVSVFAGFASERMFERWRPAGPGRIDVVRVDRPDPDEVLERVRATIRL